MEFWIYNRDIINSIVLYPLGIVLVILILILFTIKKQIHRAYDLYMQHKRFSNSDISYFSVSLLDFFYLLLPIPSKRDDAKFYKIDLVSKKRESYIDIRKWF